MYFHPPPCSIYPVHILYPLGMCFPADWAYITQESGSAHMYLYPGRTLIPLHSVT